MNDVESRDGREVSGMSSPVFSIVIPTFGRNKELQRCLEAISRIDYPTENFEVVIVDDGSAHPPDAVAEQFRGSFAFKIVRQEHAGPATARNIGVSQAAGRYIAFTDDDCVPAPGWLSQFEARFQNDEDQALGGKIENGLPGNLYSSTSQLLIDYLYSYFSGSRMHFFASNNLAFPRDRFLETGGFDESFPGAAGEDRELCVRWLEKGYRLTFLPEALVHHMHTLTLRRFWRQHFNYGRGAYRFHRIHARRSSLPIRVEPASFYMNLIRFPFRRKVQHAFRISCLLLISQIANALGFFRERFRIRNV